MDDHLQWLGFMCFEISYKTIWSLYGHERRDGYYTALYMYTDKYSNQRNLKFLNDCNSNIGFA